MSSQTEAARTQDRRTRGGPEGGDLVVWPRELCQRYGIDPCTRWRWERSKRLPPRDFYVGGKAVGWRRETLEVAEAGPAARGLAKGARPLRSRATATVEGS